MLLASIPSTDRLLVQRPPRPLACSSAWPRDVAGDRMVRRAVEQLAFCVGGAVEVAPVAVRANDGDQAHAVAEGVVGLPRDRIVPVAKVALAAAGVRGAVAVIAADRHDVVGRPADAAELRRPSKVLNEPYSARSRRPGEVRPSGVRYWMTPPIASDPYSALCCPRSTSTRAPSSLSRLERVGLPYDRAGEVDARRPAPACGWLRRRAVGSR